MSYPVHDGYHIVERYEVPNNFRNLISDWLDQQNPVIELGISADHMLSMMPRFLMISNSKAIGLDNDGIVVEWYYDGLIITLARVVGNELEAYCVQQIQVKNDDH